MAELRLLVAFIAGMVTPVPAYLFIADACGSGDLCIGAVVILFAALPVGAVAGIVAAIATPRAEGWLGYFLSVIGVPVGMFLVEWFNGDQARDPAGALAVATLSSLPILLGLSPAYAVVRFFSRADRRAVPAGSVGGDEAAAPAGGPDEDVRA